MTPLRRDGPGPFIGRARHHLGGLLYRVQHYICQSVSTNTHDAHRLLVIFVNSVRSHAATASYYFLLAQVSTSYGHSERSQTLRTSNQHLRHCACTRDTILPSHMYCCTNSITLVSAPATRDRYTAQRNLNQELLTNIGGALNVVDTPQGTPSDPQSITLPAHPPTPRHTHATVHTSTLFTLHRTRDPQPIHSSAAALKL